MSLRGGTGKGTLKITQAGKFQLLPSAQLGDHPPNVGLQRSAKTPSLADMHPSGTSGEPALILKLPKQASLKRGK